MAANSPLIVMYCSIEGGRELPGQDAEPARVGGLILGGSGVRGWMSRNVAASSSTSSVLGAEGIVTGGGACVGACWSCWHSSLSAPGTGGHSSPSLAAPDLEGHRTRSTSRHRWPRPNPRSDERQAGNGEVDSAGRGCGGGTAGRKRRRGLSRQP
jgi:hypothetical protein